MKRALEGAPQDDEPTAIYCEVHRRTFEEIGPSELKYNPFGTSPAYVFSLADLRIFNKYYTGWSIKISLICRCRCGGAGVEGVSEVTLLYFPGCAISVDSLEGGGGLIAAGESAKSSDMLYSKESSSEKEELISASASDSRDCKSIFSNGGRTAIVKSDEANASSLTGATDVEDGIGNLVIGGEAFAVESDGLEQVTAEASGFFWMDGAENDFFATET
ncbi:hypothetical protein AVEN_188045-1 [Araneus ventricosus]|uniref:Uncharacterized protein n=1 Tax=Araneus ventricosus TaxID=182803 RepID=A0A4Y2V6Q4_ARAVE|nr:hypothetical protein AVEN_188045-1 [Araneus ventricosus]